MNKSDTVAFLMTFSPVIILVVAFLIFAVPAGFKAISETKPCFSDNVAEITRLREENARLREENDAWRMDGGSCAEEVKRSREENARLRAALKVAAGFLGDAYKDIGRDEYKVAEFVARSAACSVCEGGGDA